MNNEVLQMVEIKSQTERLKLDIISYMKNLMSEYKLTLEIAAKSLAKNPLLSTICYLLPLTLTLALSLYTLKKVARGKES